MNKKNLNVDGITNELEGASLFFSNQTQSPTPIRSDSKQPSDLDHPLPSNSVEETSKPIAVLPVAGNPNHIEVTNNKTNEPPFERKNERLKARTKIRHTFDIFADQLLTLREISIEEEKITGDRVLLGDLAQQALDMFISKHRKK